MVLSLKLSLFLALKGDKKRLPFLFANVYKSVKERNKEIKSDNFRYRKVGRAIIKWGAIEKSPI